MNEPATETGRPWNRWERFWRLGFGRWLRKPLRCKGGFHTWSADSWGFGGAVIDWYCARCDRLFATTALDDARPENIERIAAVKRVLGIEGGIGEQP